ncbi:MAG: DUF1648 domain-containing protein [Actinomycetota bacterium]
MSDEREEMTMHQDRGGSAENGAEDGVENGAGTGRRLAVGIGIPVVVLALLVVPLLLFGADLPDRVATHFDGAGTPDDSMTLTGLVVFTGLLLIGPGLIMVAIAAVASRRMSRMAAPFLVGMGAFLGILGAGIVAQTAISQRNLSSWTEADNPIVGVIVLIVVAAGAGAVGAVLARGLPHDPAATAFRADPAGEAPTLDVADGERVVFTETIAPRWLLWPVVGLLALTVVMAYFTPWWIVVLVGLSTVPAVLLCALRIQADRSGLVVRSALFGIRFAKVPAEDIEEATVIDVEPMKWGGWGYRGSLRLAGAAAVVMRRGPGVHLKLSGDRVFVVTLDDPRTAAAVLNANANVG